MAPRQQSPRTSSGSSRNHSGRGCGALLHSFFVVLFAKVFQWIGISWHNTLVYSEALSALRCPTCRRGLTPDIRETDGGGDIITAGLACAGCTRTYPVREGIADFLGVPRPATPAQFVNELPATAWAYERLWRPFALTLLSQTPFPYRRELPLIAELMQPDRGGLFLDVACSNGLYARALTRAMRHAPGHVVGIDHSLVMLRDARQRARLAGLRISYVRAEAQALPIASGHAAGVVIGGSLNEIGDLDECLHETRRVLASDGRFVAMTLVQAKTWLGRIVQRALAPGGIQFWPAQTLCTVFAQHGLPTARTERTGIVLFTQSDVSE